MKKTTKRSGHIKIVRRTGNVFAQLERPGADDLVRKSRVLSVINDVIEERDLGQASAAEVLGIDQADVSRLINGKLSRFSLDRLMTFVDRLGEEIDIHQKRDRNGHLVVTVRHMARA